ncbi:hypothetical protein GCQ56_14775 [Marinifilum sp. N1E240]|uniref:hypothetical protein n=1 Tax=Marinifilum sp. N1E240 TaxID=2608082 RepID=UPI00128BFE46|nr:hypothetical protein [Marinifilum sp. N1E240]MPQ48265.1 hypothetical protein [Marinifilum sp. N1E240]
MRKFRIGLIISAVVVIVVQLGVVEYSDLSWSVNAGSYWGIISMILLIISMIYSNRYEKKNQTK